MANFTDELSFMSTCVRKKKPFVMVVNNAERDKINHFNVKNKELLVYDPVMPCGAFTQESNSVKLHCKIFQIKIITFRNGLLK